RLDLQDFAGARDRDRPRLHRLRDLALEVDASDEEKTGAERTFRANRSHVAQSDLAVDKVPVDLTRELHQLVPHVDDLVQLRAEQITRSCRLVLLRPHRSLRDGDRITLLDSRESRKRNCKLPAPQTLKPCNLKSPKPPENDSRSEAYKFFTAD